MSGAVSLTLKDGSTAKYRIQAPTAEALAAATKDGISKQKVSSYDLEQAGTMLTIGETPLSLGVALKASVDPTVVTGMLELPAHAVERCCAEASGAGLLAVAERDYEFANDLVQEILYATTPAPVRRAHHRRAADLSTGQPEVVGRHAAAARVGDVSARTCERGADPDGRAQGEGKSGRDYSIITPSEAA